VTDEKGWKSPSLRAASRVNCAPELFYWLREGKTGNAEVGFLAADAGGVLPIEVKAGQSGALACFKGRRD